MPEIFSQVLGYKKIFSIFPELYNYKEFSPLLLRVTLATTLIVVGWKFFSKKTGWRGVNVVIGIVEIGTGVLLVLAAYTQLAALLSVIISIMSIIAGIRKGEGYFFWQHLLTLAISISLLLTGPGIMSLDLPL